jgi:hypothetical protein
MYRKEITKKKQIPNSVVANISVLPFSVTTVSNHVYSPMLTMRASTTYRLFYSRVLLPHTRIITLTSRQFHTARLLAQSNVQISEDPDQPGVYYYRTTSDGHQRIFFGLLKHNILDYLVGLKLKKAFQSKKLLNQIISKRIRCFEIH